MKKQNSRNKSPVTRDILYILKKAKGKPVQYSQLAPEKGDKKTKKTGSRPDSRRGVVTPKNLIDLLADLKLVELRGKLVIPAYPFMVEARLSVTPAGLAFGMGPFDKDIVIPPPMRNGARHRDKVWIEITDASGGRLEGRVLSIIEPFTTHFLAKVVSEYSNYGYLITLNDLPDNPYGIIKPGKIKIFPGDYIIVHDSGESLELAIDQEHPASKRKDMRSYFLEHPVYVPEKRIEPGNFTSDVLRVAARYNIPMDYEKKVIPKKREMKKLTSLGMKEKSRKNLTKLYACTIDGADSKDFDDAISYEERDGRRILYVHIADVSHYVEKGTALDNEALKRGNSYYLKHKVFPMLPPLLSEDFCSLNPKTKRLAFTCEMHYNHAGDIIEYFLYKSIIHLGKRFTYEKAEGELEKPKSQLYPIWQLARQLLEKRIKAGKIELNIKETEVVIDAHGRIITMGDKLRLNSHRMIEECMLSANTCTAHFMKEKKIPGLYRVHDPMPATGLQKINEFLKLYGYRTQIKSLHYSEIHKLIKMVSGTSTEEIFNYILLRSFSQAAYKKDPLGHWGLGFPDYTHFTSPIRRYSDLVVHRQIDACLRKTTLPYQKSELEYIGHETSRLERVAMEAERTTSRMISMRYMKEKTGEIFNAWFSGFSPAGLYIQLTDNRIEGFVPVAKFSRRGEVESIDSFRVQLPRYSKTISLGTKMKVKLVSIDWEKIHLVFEIVKIEK